jgi:hypothetical protein
MFGIPLMFMCLTYTGDLLADAFISVYSSIVNFFYRQLCRGRLKKYIPDEARQSFEQPDVRSLFFVIFSFFNLLFSSLSAKRLGMYLLSLL